MRRLTRLVTLALAISGLFGIMGVAEGQVPSLNPEQTVNLSTGEMGFCLPLGTVQGVNGHNFPVTLNYKAGIRVSDEASPAGLGFSYGPGCVYRKVMFVPDECKGGKMADGITPRYKSTPPDTDPCTAKWWVYLVQILLIVVSIAICFIPIANGLVGLLTFYFTFLAPIGMSLIVSAIFAPNQYIGGGNHLPIYNPKAQIGEAQHGLGILNGGTRDLPDAYFVNCPYLSGQIVLIQEDNGYRHFVLQQTSGSPTSTNQTVKIDYDKTRESFSFVLQDGTRLLFEQGQYSKEYSATFWQYHPQAGNDCWSTHEEVLNDSLPNQWMLTKVLFPDFKDQDGDNDPTTHPEMNSGSWIVFKYNVAEYSDVSQLPFSAQGAPHSSMVFHNNGYLMDVYLENIITPNQSAQFFYQNNRLDGLLFRTSDFANWSSNLSDYLNKKPAASLLRASSGSTVAPIRRKVLDSIVFYSPEKVKLKKAVFHTDYSLRPQTFTSYSKDGSGAFIPVTLDGKTNSSGASLTLKSVVISGADGKDFSPITFEYSASNPAQWESNLYNIPDGCDGSSTCESKRMAYYIEKRDLFGFYVPNSTNNNDFNERGKAVNTQQLEAWSLKKVNFSTGSSIAWEYEPNRYDRANNFSVSGELQPGNIYLPVFYGGGIRVRKITIDDGISKKHTWNYFYTDNGFADFDEAHVEPSTVSTGHITVEPFPYRLASNNDLRDRGARGGFYTPCQVYYEKVQVVKNFNELNWSAPQGYSIYKFTTSKDHPNGGLYGQSDSSWMRGLQTSEEKHNSNSKLITQTTINYSFVPMTWVNYTKMDIFDSLFMYQGSNSYGWVRVSNKEEKNNNVIMSKQYKYAMEIGAPQPYTEKITNIRSINKFEPWTDGEPPFPSQLIVIQPDVGGAYTMTRLFGNAGFDHVLALPFVPLRGAIQIQIASDLLESQTSGDAWHALELPWYDQTTCLIGVSVWNYDNNSNPEMMVFFAGTSVTNYNIVTCVFLKNLTYDNSSGTWNYTLGGQAQFHFNTFTSDKRIVSCATGNISSTSNYPGVVFLEGDADDPGKSMSRRVYYIDNLPLAQSEHYDHYYYPNNIQSTGLFYFPGNKIWLNDAQTTIASSVEITGLRGNVVYHTKINKFTQSLATMEPQENFFNVGSLNTSEESDELRYYGMNCYTDDNGLEKRYLFFFRPQLNGNNPRLTIATKWVRDVECDIDGTTKEVWSTAPNNKKFITKTIPAYWKYFEMQSAHMLTQTSQTIVYEKPSSDNSTTLNSSEALSSQATGWNTLSNGNWLPCSTYVWSTPKNSSGAATTELPEFNFSSLSSNDATWKFKGGTTKYDSNSMAIESVNPKNVYSTTVYGTTARLQIGSISNAQCYESGVFTCDYNTGENIAYWDHTNGWLKGDDVNSNGVGVSLYGGVSSDASNIHYGQKSVYVKNHYAVGRNNLITPGKAYIMSAWVKVTSGKLYMASDYRYGTNASEWPAENVTKNYSMKCDSVSITADACNGKWKLLKLLIPASKTSQLTSSDNTVWYARAWVGNAGDFGNTDGVTAYIDDVRFYPVNAQVSTTYYDTLWQQPILTVGTDNNPGKKVVYDDFGRPVKWYKVDKSNPANNTIVQQKEYHLMGDYYKPNSTKWYKIVPEANDSYCIDISGTSATWNTGSIVHLWPYYGNINQQWKFVSTSDGYYNIVSRVADGNGNYIYAIDDPYGMIEDTGTVLKLYTISDDNQKWKLTDAGGGYCRISVKANDAAYIDLKNGVAIVDGGAKVQMWVNGTNTKWKLVEVE
jgi:hypothetical protein